jgi:pimeloyl-ACP methyl ester carboxylesterase
MDRLVRDVNVHYEEAGSGRPILILHGWEGDGLTTMPEFEPFFTDRPGWRRIYPDVMSMPIAPVPEWLQGPDQVLDVLIEFMDLIAPAERFSVAGVSKGAYFGLGIVHHRPDRVDGACFSIPLLESANAHPEHPLAERQVLRHDPAMVAALRPGEEWVLDYLTVQSEAALEGVRRWQFPAPQTEASESVFRHKWFSFEATALAAPFPGPVLMLLGHQDADSGFRAGWSMIEQFPRGTFAVLDAAGHFLDVEQPGLRHALISDWLDRVAQYATGGVAT